MSNVILIFIDGLGLGPDDIHFNPMAKRTVTLGSNIRLVQGAHYENDLAIVIPTDACLGVEGIPQSATGQTTLLTGVNASALLGYHKSAYPNEQLSKILADKGVFTRCKNLGYTATFANGFRKEYWKLIAEKKRRHSATTLCVTGAKGVLRQEEELQRGEAIYHDITGHSLRLTSGAIPYVAPEEAGRRLGKLAENNHFTLFEYFLTDVLGHRKHMEPILNLFNDLEAFLSGLLNTIDLNQTAVMITSDHGNVEDLTTPIHTKNKVPTILYGPIAKKTAPMITNLTHIVPAIMYLLSR